MAVDYFHRLLVSGKPADVRAFRDAIYREYPRTIAGETWTEIAPFSFAGLYELAPAARRVERRSRTTRMIYRPGLCARWRVSVQRYATKCTHVIWS